MEHIRLAPMCDSEPKATEKSSFEAGSGLNALATDASPLLIYLPSVFGRKSRADDGKKTNITPKSVASCLKLFPFFVEISPLCQF